MADAKKPRVKNEKEPVKATEKDYVEIRLPRITMMNFPLPLVLVLMLLSFLAGYFGPNLLSPKETAITDIPSAFSHYAKLAKLDVKKFNTCFASSKYEQNIKTDIAAGEKAGVNATPTFFINGEPLVGALPFDVFKAYIDHELTGAPIPEDKLVSTDSAKQDIAAGHLPPEGSNKKVTIVEFSDFQCPFCERFYSDAYSQLKKEYIDTGKITFTYRHFPLTSIHPNAQPAALAAECASEQGKFWEYHDLLFKNQSAWANLTMSAPTQ